MRDTGHCIVCSALCWGARQVEHLRAGLAWPHRLMRHRAMQVDAPIVSDFVLIAMAAWAKVAFQAAMDSRRHRMAGRAIPSGSMASSARLRAPGRRHPVAYKALAVLHEARLVDAPQRILRMGCPRVNLRLRRRCDLVPGSCLSRGRHPKAQRWSRRGLHASRRPWARGYAKTSDQRHDPSFEDAAQSSPVRAVGMRAGLAHLVMHGESRHSSLGCYRTRCDDDAHTVASNKSEEWVGGAPSDTMPKRAGGDLVVQCGCTGRCPNKTCL